MYMCLCTSIMYTTHSQASWWQALVRDEKRVREEADREASRWKERAEMLELEAARSLS